MEAEAGGGGRGGSVTVDMWQYSEFRFVHGIEMIDEFYIKTR